VQDPIRVALLGYGLAGRLFHAPFIAAVPELHLRAIVTADSGRAAQARADYPTATVLSTAEEVLTRAGDFDLVVVATANRAHVPQATAALRAGLHVLVDKPLAADAATARELSSVAAAADRQLHVYQNRRYDSDFRTVRRLMDAGALGRVTRLESRFERWRPEAGSGWRDRPEPEAMGGVLYDLGAHLIDQAVQLLGPVTSVDASVRSQRSPGGPDDDAAVTLTHAQGAVSNLWMSAVAAHQGPRFRVLGMQGALVIQGLDAQEARLRAGERPRPDDPQWGRQPTQRAATLYPQATSVELDRGDYGDFYRDLVASLRGMAKPPVALTDVIASLAIMDAARTSSSEHRRVPLSPG
jgi:scyllo-inositol 2-dehydrogenase (NADP+)